MIKYLGSKRLLIPHIISAVKALGVGSVGDVFAGTTRVGQACKEEGCWVVSNDLASYTEQFGRCYIEADADDAALEDVPRLLGHLNSLVPQESWFVEDYCRNSRYFQPENGRKIAAVREEIEYLHLDPLHRGICLTSLLEAADAVDNTVGVQMAYLKDWCPRSYKPLELRVPRLIPGSGEVCRQDANTLVGSLDCDALYLDPPYNQHSYRGNYHVWETLVRWDHPETYGVAMKRQDCQTEKSRYNSKRECRDAFTELVAARAPYLLVSYSSEGFISASDVGTILSEVGYVVRVSIPFRRYVGHKIGTHNPDGVKVSEDGPAHNTEYLYLVGQDCRKLQAACQAIDRNNTNMVQ